MNALDIQNILVSQHNNLSGMPLTESTLALYKENLANSVKSIALIDEYIHLTPLREQEQHQLIASSVALKHIFYCLCLTWVPNVKIMSDVYGYTTKVTITKADLFSDEDPLVIIGSIGLYIINGELKLSEIYEPELFR